MTNPPRNAGRALWLYGRHAVLAALRNPDRAVLRLRTIREDDEAAADARRRGVPCETVGRRALDRLLGAGAVHQGLALEVRALAPPGPEAVARRRLLLLDRVSDMRNVGAILRSAEAFGADAVLMPSAGAPTESGALAKAAAGALERVPMIAVPNLARSMERLKRTRGFWFVALADDAADTLADTDLRAPTGLVLGAEGAGVRRIVRRACDHEARIPMAGDVGSLNVAVAAGIALYELDRRAGGAAEERRPPRPGRAGGLRGS